LEHKTGIDLTVLLRLKKPSKTIHVYFQTFRIILNPSSVKNKATLGKFGLDEHNPLKSNHQTTDVVKHLYSTSGSFRGL